MIMVATTALLAGLVPTGQASAPGLVLDAPPAHLAAAPDPETASLALVREALELGQRSDALRLASLLASGPDPEAPRQTAAAAMVVGLLRREHGQHNLANEAFATVRDTPGPLTPWGTYFAAEQDLLRGRPTAAVGACASYLEEWPHGVHRGDCQRLLAMAHAAQGDAAAARQAATAYDQENRLGQISEQIELRLARRWIAEGTPQPAIDVLRELVVDHEAPLAGRVAEAWLATLREDGHAQATIPEDRAARIRRAVSLRDARRRDAAWEVFAELAARADDDPVLAAFVEEEGERFAWRTHRWDWLAEEYARQYAETREPRRAWSQYRVLFRGGRAAEAAELALQMQRAHAGESPWKHSHEDVGRIMMLAGRYDDAREQFDHVARRGGWTGRRNRFYAAFATLMSGDAEEAAERLSIIVEHDRSWRVEARYWRARAYELLSRDADATADRAWILEHDPHSWYAVLVRQHAADAPVMAPLVRAGRWAGPRAPETVAPLSRAASAAGPRAAPPVRIPTSPLHVPTLPSRRVAATSLAWPWARPDAAPASGAPAAIALLAPERVPPRSYVEGPLWDPDAGLAALGRFTERFAGYWPELRAIHDLAEAGLYDLSGPLFSEWYEQWRRDYRRRRRTARRVRRMSTADWRELFFAARDHHHASRFSHRWWEEQDRPETVLHAWRLAYPVAHDHVVWQASRRHHVDPFLILGLMRQESTYRATAVSRVGARGAMQIMPRTGHLLADLADDVEFTAGDLVDPELSIRYGIRYLGLLLERFEGAFPLAVASYNGGPFNVSAWLSSTGADLPMDAFVEHIPFRETRRYVKKVTEGYARYVQLYGPNGARVIVPPQPRGDHPEVVDF